MAVTAPTDILERDLQRHVRAMLAQFDWRTAVTWTSLHSPKGWPDCFAVRCVACRTAECANADHATEAVALELKREKGKTTPEQDAWLDLLARLPGVKFAGLVRPSMWFGGELDEVLR